MSDWRAILAPGLRRDIPEAELATRIQRRIEKLEAENQRLAIKCGEMKAPDPSLQRRQR